MPERNGKSGFAFFQRLFDFFVSCFMLVLERFQIEIVFHNEGVMENLIELAWEVMVELAFREAEVRGFDGDARDKGDRKDDEGQMTVVNNLSPGAFWSNLFCCALVEKYDTIATHGGRRTERMVRPIEWPIRHKDTSVDFGVFELLRKSTEIFFYKERLRRLRDADYRDSFVVKRDFERMID